MEIERFDKIGTDCSFPFTNIFVQVGCLLQSKNNCHEYEDLSTNCQI